MRSIFISLISALVSVFSIASYSYSQITIHSPESKTANEFVIGTTCEVSKTATRDSSEETQPAADIEREFVNRMDTKTFYVHSSEIPQTRQRVGFGGALNFKYYCGLSYEFLQKELPGKTISLDIFVPKSSISPDSMKPNRLRVSIKSEKDGEWVEYYPDAEWIRVNRSGLYSVKIRIPDGPIGVRGGKVFYPDRTALFSVEYYLMEGSKHHSHVAFYFSNFKIDGIKFNQDKLKWQFLKDGYCMQGVYLPSFFEGSTFINYMGRGIDISCRNLEAPFTVKHPFKGELKDVALTFSIFIPQELRHQKGSVILSVKDNDGKTRRAFKYFSSCNLEGKTFLTVPLDGFFVSESIEDIIKNAEISIRIRTTKPYDPSMMPLVIEPLKIIAGELIPFDAGWQARDPQGKGAYPFIEVRADGLIGKSGVTVTELSENLYQMDATVRLKGGIDWESPYYRMEFMRPFGKTVNMDNKHIEVVISPMTNTTDVWQKPFRARVGLLDVNDNLIFGPNVSLSEGLSSLATLEVSILNPIPKGYTMPGFDPKKVKALIINLEASHAFLEPRDIKVSFSNLIIMDRPELPVKRPTPIDFSRFKRNPKGWVINKMIDEKGGYLVGINYPFPVVDVPVHVLEVPQVYPCVGMKPMDPMHLGFSSEVTKKALLKDFTTFAEHDVDVVRLLVLGHLEGIFKWDERGFDIKYFCEGKKGLVNKMAEMPVEDLARFLNENENEIFEKDREGSYSGIEKYVIEDFISLFDSLEQVENQTGKRVTVILSLYDFMLGDGITEEGPLRKYNVGEHAEVVTNPYIKVKAEALMWKIMKEISKDARFYKYVAVMEIMNEPDNATNLSTRENLADLVNFVGENLYLVKDAIGGATPVSVGFRSWHLDLKYWQNLGEGIDILLPHYWQSLESYNIDLPGLWPLDMPKDKMWEFLGTEAKKRPAGIGEISPGGNIKEKFFRIETAGYDLALAWSFSGHDGHDARPVMESIKEYQKGNYSFKKLKGSNNGLIKKAFEYFISARSLGDISRGLKNVKDEELKKVIISAEEVFKHKSIPFTYQNVKYVFKKALKK